MANLKVTKDAIPKELRKIDQWVLWNYGTADEKGKRPKIPFKKKGVPASTKDPKTWLSFKKAYRLFIENNFDGIGFVFTKDDPYVGNDLDDCRNPETGEIEGWAVKIIDTLHSYSEISPSGTGIKTFLKGKLPNGPRRKENIEIYDQDRYFTVTGDHLTGTPKKIRKCPKALRKFYEEKFSTALANENSAGNSMKKIEKSMRYLNKNNAIDKLFKGDWSSYPSQSEGDLVLCSHLARQTDRDPEKIDELFRKSGLMRKKWDEQHYANGQTYGEATIQKAIKSCWKGGKDRVLDVRKAIEDDEQGDAEVFIEMNRGRYCFDHSSSQWFRWDTHFWKPDLVDNVFVEVPRIGKLYKKYGETLLKEASEDLKEGGNADAEEKQSLARSIKERIRKLNSITRRKRILTLAQSGEKSLGINGYEWDTKPEVLACANGVLRLSDGEVNFDAGSPFDYISKCIPTKWVDFEAPCPIWKRFLKDIFQDDKKIIKHIRKILGYSLTGKGSEHIFVILHGIGRNGKTTFVETLRNVLGALATPIPSETLLAQPFPSSGGSPRADLIKLQGARIAWAKEANVGRWFDSGMIKALTGGDTITARGPFGKQMRDFPPTHTLFFMTNNLPHVPASEYAFWQRVHVIPFKVKFVAEPEEEHERKRDRHLSEKLKKEAPGILAWIVKGYMLYHKYGLKRPPAVKGAVEDYFESGDPIKRFISQCCKKKVGATVNATSLYKRYVEWCEDEGIAFLKQAKFGRELKTRKFRKKTSNGVHYLGIKLRKVTTT